MLNATSAPFHNINVNEEFLTQLKTLILNPTEDDLDYPIILIRYYSQEYKDINPKSISISQHLTDEIPHVFSTLLAGWEWIVYFNNNRELNKKWLLDMRIKNNELYEIHEADIIECRHIANRLGKNIIENKFSFILKKISNQFIKYLKEKTSWRPFL